MKIDNWVILLVLFLILFDVFVWKQVVFDSPNENLEVYFLEVGQGDSELVFLPGGVKILIDGGPNSKILDELSSILRPTDRYIDLAVLSHPELDHFGGLIDVLKRYQIGAFIFNGRRGTAPAFHDLEKIIKENNIAAVVLGEGDGIKYIENQFSILSPSEEFLSSYELNDTTLVMKFENESVKILFTGDIDKKIEYYLIEKYDLNVDILKVAHHGSRFSSSEGFIKETSPKVSVIEVGKNSYGHPTKYVLNKLASIGSQIFRTDKNGTVKLVIDAENISIFNKY
ncbi:MAG TPA: MBL fold metallo-hydrolase [Candidatus Wolfebacteria bacterium]|nr:MBL fold metallo-hydrolase [Candidatus Wolfebacteria bacterium]